MTAEQEQIIREELDSCERVLSGETVRGVNLQSAGITPEWLTRRIAEYLRILATNGVAMPQNV